MRSPVLALAGWLKLAAVLGERFEIGFDPGALRLAERRQRQPLAERRRRLVPSKRRATPGVERVEQSVASVPGSGRRATRPYIRLLLELEGLERSEGDGRSCFETLGDNAASHPGSAAKKRAKLWFDPIGFMRKSPVSCKSSSHRGDWTGGYLARRARSRQLFQQREERLQETSIEPASGGSFICGNRVRLVT